jgi:hypothetical protein
MDWIPVKYNPTLYTSVIALGSGYHVQSLLEDTKPYNTIKIVASHNIYYNIIVHLFCT